MQITTKKNKLLRKKKKKNCLSVTCSNLHALLPRVLLKILLILTYLNLTRLWRKPYYYFRFTDQETESTEEDYRSKSLNWI